MKIINAKSSMKLTLKFTRHDILRLAEVCSVYAEVMDFCAEEASKAYDGALCMEQIEIAEEGLELLCKILKSSEDIR